MNGNGESKVLIKFLLNFRQSGDVLFFLNVRRLRGYTATQAYSTTSVRRERVPQQAQSVLTNAKKLRTLGDKKSYLMNVHNQKQGDHQEV